MVVRDNLLARATNVTPPQVLVIQMATTGNSFALLAIPLAEAMFDQAVSVQRWDRNEVEQHRGEIKECHGAAEMNPRGVRRRVGIHQPQLRMDASGGLCVGQQ